MKQKPAQQSKLNIQLRPASVEEAGLFYSQMEEGEDRSLGTVGHLRMDFGHRGPGVLEQLVATQWGSLQYPGVSGGTPDGRGRTAPQPVLSGI